MPSASIRDKVTQALLRLLGLSDFRKQWRGVLEQQSFVAAKTVEFQNRLQALSSAASAAEDQLKAITNRFEAIKNQLETVSKNLELKLEAVSEGLEKISDQVRQTEEPLAMHSARFQPWLPEENFKHSEPEYYLASFLCDFLPGRIVVDVGANEGDFTMVLSDAGNRVFAFEPFPPVFQTLRARVADRKRVTVYNLALGATETTLPLFVAKETAEQVTGDGSLYNTFRPHFVRESVEFSETVKVPVKTLAGLVKSGEVPKDIDFLKIDTEGFDLEVIRGMDQIAPTVLQTEFWGSEFVFVRNEADQQNIVLAAQIIAEMRNRGYWWNLIVFRVEGENEIRYATNMADAPKKAWGNLLFFRDAELFAKACDWCRGALPRFLSRPAE